LSISRGNRPSGGFSFFCCLCIYSLERCFIDASDIFSYIPWYIFTHRLIVHHCKSLRMYAISHTSICGLNKKWLQLSAGEE
jgi:hypothetical protein